jgi:ribonuclease P protein component
MKQFTLCKEERLSSRKEIELLFAEGQSLTSYPVRLVWRESAHPLPPDKPIQVMFSVSKKKISRAVDRNRMKRLMKENYRLNKPGIYSSLPAGKSYHLAWIYSSDELLDFITIQKGVTTALERWMKKCRQL